MIEDDCTTNGVPLPNVTSKVLAKIVDYCIKHAAVSTDKTDGSNAAIAAVKEELKSFDAAFIDLDKVMLYDLLLAANFMNIKSLLDLACERTADLLRGKAPEEIRKEFGIKNEAIRKENAWAFE